jgi:hypothetical protein
MLPLMPGHQTPKIIHQPYIKPKKWAKPGKNGCGRKDWDGRKAARRWYRNELPRIKAQVAYYKGFVIGLSWRSLLVF